MNSSVDTGGLPFSPTFRAGDLVFVSGQVPLDMESGRTVGSSLVEQVAQVMANLKGAVVASGASMGDVVKTTVFMTDIHGLEELNAEYARHFQPGRYPARSAVEVSALARPNWLVEIEAIVFVDSTTSR
jgi:2-iminobutanoate/2-iminopropanoate deaminase